MYKTIDLFAGAGGLSLGFQQTGKFKIVAAAEINKNARATYRKNIFKDRDTFEFMDNVVGCDFKELNKRLEGIEVVIGGPPCQGFSNANRQKSHLINMNNSLAKEYFRAIKEIKPKAFVMENVNMLRSDTHRFYDSAVDNEEIDNLIAQGFKITKRLDIIFISSAVSNIDMLGMANAIDNTRQMLFPEQLRQLLRVLYKNINHQERLVNYLKKKAKALVSQIDAYINGVDKPTKEQASLIEKIRKVKLAVESNQCENAKEDLAYIVDLQKAFLTITEIYENRLIGKFTLNEKEELVYEINSYSVIDYINAILGTDYIQAGGTLNAEWFGVPQERRRYIIFGIRKDMIDGKEVSVPNEPDEYKIITVGEAIFDLNHYPVGYEKKYTAVPYDASDEICTYATLMREDSEGVKNHIATATTDTAMERFKAIGKGKNFHSLSSDMKKTYSKPERTQNTIYLRLDPTKPSGTVVNVRKSMWIHPELDRAITVREAARLQSFPDTFEFIGTKDSQYQQVGNAVPPLLAKGIAEKLLEYLK